MSQVTTVRSRDGHCHIKRGIFVSFMSQFMTHQPDQEVVAFVSMTGKKRGARPKRNRSNGPIGRSFVDLHRERIYMQSVALLMYDLAGESQRPTVTIH